MKNDKQVDNSRRELLKGMATAAVAGAVVAGTTTVASASEEKPLDVKKKKMGYHETQHIRDYYDSL